MAERLRRGGHEVVGYDRNPNSPRTVASTRSWSPRWPRPRAIWVMVPSGEPTRATVGELADELVAGDLIIDGGNSRYTDDQTHARDAREEGHPATSTSVSPAGSGVSPRDMR